MAPAPTGHSGSNPPSPAEKNPPKTPKTPKKCLYIPGPTASFRAPVQPLPAHFKPLRAMKVLSSLASAKRRHADCQVVKRKGTVYVICKSNPKFKARQGATVGTRLGKKGVK